MIPLDNELQRHGARPNDCQRRDFDDWTCTGGPLPAAFATHLADCPACAERVRRIVRVTAMLTLVRTRPMPAGLVGRATRHGLQLLRYATRASAEASRMLTIKPDLAWWRRAQLQATRVSTGLAAALLLLVVRAGLRGGYEQTRSMGESLARTHWLAHIDPEGEWLEPVATPADADAAL